MPKKILIAESDPLFLEDISARLSQRPEVQVITCNGGIEAIKKTRRQKPQLLILDEHLSGLDGYKVSRLIKFDKKYSHIPIFLLAANVNDTDRRLAKEVNADEYISKFGDRNELFSKIEEYLKRI
jgi:CheY-like chemotaxis protein